MVPEGWDIFPLEDLASVDRGKFSARPRNDPQFFEGPYPFVQTGDVARSSIYLWGHSQTLNDAGLAVSRMFPANTILITIAANIGDVALTRYPVACPDSVVGIVVKPQKADPVWLIHRLVLEKTGLDKAAPKLAQKNINLEVLRPLPILTPPLPEQQKIAEILGTWDKAIETTEALLANARTQKRALMQSLLTGTRRFPGFEDHPWREVRLGDVAEVDRNSLGSKTPDSHEFEYISLTNVEPGHIVEPLTRLTFGEAPSRARRLVAVGDILMSTVRPNLQGFAKVTPRFADCVASTGFAVVSPGANVSGSYLFHYLFSDLMTTQLDALVVGSNYPAINSSDVKQLKINLPVLEEQNRIGVLLDDCDRDIRQLDKEADHLRTEKKSLMQQLLTGKRRVAV